VGLTLSKLVYLSQLVDLSLFVKAGPALCDEYTYTRMIGSNSNSNTHVVCE